MSCPYRRACPNSSSWSWSWSSAPQNVQYYSNCPNQSGGNGGEDSDSSNFTAAKGHPPIGPKEFSGNYYEYGQYLHNWYRRRHGAGDLVLVDRLNRAGDEYCATLAPRRTLVHSTGRDYGENLFMTTDTSISDKEAVRQACKGWYDEIEDYSFGNPGFSSGTGHFTAMVWRSSTELGIGVGRGNGCVVVAGCYKVHPNMMGEFGSNVLRFRQVPDTDDEDSEDDEEAEKAEASSKKKETTAAAPSATKAKSKKESEEDDKVLQSLKAAADKNGSIGPEELKAWLNDNIKVTFKFNGFDELIAKLLISITTIDEGEKDQVDKTEEFTKILTTVRGLLDSYSMFDADGSGTLDPFELRDALKEAGFSLSYNVFLTLYSSLMNKETMTPKEMILNFREFVLVFLVLTKLQVVQRKRAEKVKAGGFLDDFSLKDWVKEQIE